VILGVWDPAGAARWAARVRWAASGAATREGPTVIAAGDDTADVEDSWCLLSGQLLEPFAGEHTALDADGAFAAISWRDGRGLLWCDPLGLGSLFLTRSGSALLFASELTGLLALLERTPEPDPDALRRWLARAISPVGGTLLRGVERLRPGVRLVLQGSAAREEPQRRPAPPARATEGDPAVLVRDAVIRAVRRRCPEGEPVAVLVSGGLDSTIVAAVGARELPPECRPQAHYSVLFPGHRGQDESEWIGAVAAELGTRSVRMSLLSGSIVGGMLDWTEEHRAPLPAANWFYQRPLLQRIAADGARAVLDGEGGDELFSAPRALLADHMRHGRLARAWRQLEALPNAHQAPLRVRARAFTEYAVRGALPYELHRRLAALRRGAEWSAFEDRWGWQRSPGPRWSAQLIDVLTDGMARVGAHEHFRLRAASAGLGVRHPLLDLDLVELVLSLPPGLALDPVYSRPLLRRSMEGLVPAAVLRRTDKARFESLVVRQLRGPDLPSLQALLGPHAEVLAFLPAGWPRQLAAPPGDSRELPGWADRVFRAAAAECWLQTLAEPEFPRRFRAECKPEPTRVTFEE
jgi:asparagine synthase (glutamine-hydrolysing)